MRRFKTIIILLFIFIFTSKVNAKVVFTEENKDYYQKLCSNKTSYELNKEACDAFEKHQLKNDNQVKKIAEEIDESNLTSDQIVKMINETNNLISQKEAEIAQNTKIVEENTVKSTELTEDLLSSIETMQYMNTENQVIDVLMNATSVDDLMLRMDSISSISRANYDTVLELEKASTELEDAKRYLDEDLETLKTSKAKQEALLAEFRAKEAKYYTTYSSASSGIVFNDSIEKLSVAELTDNSAFGRPTPSGVVTASTWYYPGGGAWHPGLDIGVPVGTNLIAPLNGAILASGTVSGGYGVHTVMIAKKGDYVYTMIFGHLSSFSSINGFKKGTVIGATGNTGRSDGPHVHVEIFQHNTKDVKAVIAKYKANRDYYFGLGYNTVGDCANVCRLEPSAVFSLSLGQAF